MVHGPHYGPRHFAGVFMIWPNVLTVVLISLQECFPHKVYAAYIIKPEKFWEKQKTSLGSAKYKFEVGPPHCGMAVWPVTGHNRDLYVIQPQTITGIYLSFHI